MSTVSRKKKFLINTAVSALSEIVSMVCGLILPRMILSHFGSSYNGLISSITQIISFVTLLRAGVGGVTRAALYKPLAENDIEKISGIVNATERFMKRIAIAFMMIAIGIACVYPFIVSDFDWLFTFILFLVLSISTFIQYYFGITYQMLLMADQRQYVFTAMNIGAIILNTVLSCVLIELGCSIITVKLGAAIAFTSTPIIANIYVRRYYKIDKHVAPDKSALTQRWDALGHQIAYYIFTSTDLTILTLLADVKIVSVYTVFHLPIKAIKMVIKTYASSAEAAFGNILAKKQKKTLQLTHDIFECFMFVSCTFLFSCAAALIIPFIRVYTAGVTDANYYQPLFAILLLLGELVYCLRIPYMTLVESSGQYKQTKRGAYIEAILNITVSVILCFLINPLVAVATGTLVALIYRTFEISRFSDIRIVGRPRTRFYINMVLSTLVLLSSYYFGNLLPLYNACDSYLRWIILAAETVVIVTAILAAIVLVFYRKQFSELVAMLKSVIKKKK